MINATDIIKFDRTEEELEELALFLIAVAGKNADTTARMLEDFLHVGKSVHFSPFEIVQHYNKGLKGSFSFVRNKETVSRDFTDLKSALKAVGFGCQTRLAKAFTEMANSGLNLKTCSRDDLLKIHGIGLKSANCFMSWTRKDTKLAMLDTHLMKFIRNDLGHTDAPKSTPSSPKQYAKWEKVYLDRCAEKNVDPTEYDLQIWKRYAGRE